MKKKLCKYLLVLLLLNASVNCAFSRDFSDMEQSHWAYKEIQSLGNDSVIVGYPDGTFIPEKPATKAEFATMVVKALRKEHIDPDEIFYFSDVPQDHWAYKNIQRACAFDLLQGLPDGTFQPEDSISKVEAISILISAINTDKITPAQAQEALKIYEDFNDIPEWAILQAGKAEKLGMTAHNPMSFSKFDPNKKITRAEIAANLFNMREQAKINPNYKLAPKKANGITIDDVQVDGTVAVIPAGTELPVNIVTPLNSQSDETGSVFSAEAPDNFVTKENYLLIPKGASFFGEIVKAKPARYFIRNAKMDLDSKYVKTSFRNKSDLPGNVDLKLPRKKGFSAFINFIIKGSKIRLQEGSTVYIKLLKPVTIDLTSTTVLQ